MKAVIYCRVSIDAQERDGTSLQTQLDNSLKYCQSKGYEVYRCFSETYSGLSLERPELNRLRELVRSGGVDVVICHSLDRLSRDPTHGVILTQELEKHDVKLEAVTEDISNTELGKLISYIRGFASKLEAEKIKERTSRGRRARALMGKIPHGGYAKLYGYNYIKVGTENGGRRVINDDEAYWVKQIFEWLVNEKMSSSAIRNRLIELKAPTKLGGQWCRAAVIHLVKNPSYAGKTYFNTTIKKRPYAKNSIDWVEMPGLTPPIISQDLFDIAQKQLADNRALSNRNTRHEYLLRGRLFCKQCGHRYYGSQMRDRRKNGYAIVPRYRCESKSGDIERKAECHNKSWRVEELNDLIWQHVERVIAKPDLIISIIEAQHQETQTISNLDDELKGIIRKLNALDRDQEKLLDWALKGFPEATVISENKKINSKRNALKAQEAELIHNIKSINEAKANLPKIEGFIKLIQKRISSLDFETKKLVLEMLDIKIWIDGENVEMRGAIPVDSDAIETTHY